MLKSKRLGGRSEASWTCKSLLLVPTQPGPHVAPSPTYLHVQPHTCSRTRHTTEATTTSKIVAQGDHHGVCAASPPRALPPTSHCSQCAGSPCWPTVALIDLPVDILLLILAECQIEELLSIRLTCSALRKVIHSNEKSILPAVARNTFPNSALLLRNAMANARNYDVIWLKNLMFQQLAAILVDKHGEVHSRQRIPAEDPRGDALRARVANGWKVLGRLFKIADEIYNMDPKAIMPPKSKLELVLGVLYWPRSEAALSQQKEKLIMNRRLQYMRNMKFTDAQDYVIMFTMLSGVFRVAALGCHLPENSVYYLNFRYWSRH